MTPAPRVDPASERILRRTILPFIRAVWRPRLVETGHFPTGPCFVYGNHAHNLDPFILNLFTPWGRPTAGVLTMEYMRGGGLVARLLRGIGLLATRKSVPEPHLIRAIYRLLDEGRAIVIYPEGGRRWDGRPSPWSVATAKIFARMGVPIYPVRTHGSYVGWPRWARWPRPARIEVEVGAPLQFAPRTPWREALAPLKAAIALDENVVPPRIRPRFAYRPADGIDRLLYRDPDTGVNGGLYSPDGRAVTNRARTLRWRMQPDSTLVDAQTGETLLTGDLYARVRALPLVADADGAFVQNDVVLHEEPLGDVRTADPLAPRGRVHAALLPDAIRLHGAAVFETIPLDAIRYVGIERNYKLQLTLKGRVLQLAFDRGGSALQWADTLERLVGPGSHLA